MIRESSIILFTISLDLLKQQNIESNSLSWTEIVSR